MNVFADTLRRIAERVEGVQAVSLVGVDGIPVDSWGTGKDSALEAMAAEMGAFVKAARSRQAGTSDGPIQQLCLMTGETTAILSRVTEEYYLLLLLSPEGNLGRGRFELRKAALALEKELL
jgi:predicted regulator of Ras-like GTPase activity (Roadblock/LC7/MglB family)